MQRWEYLREVLAAPHGSVPDSDDLDPFGKEGWELVALCLSPSGNYIGVFKRPLKETRIEGE